MGLFDKYRKNNLNESKDWSSAMENNNTNIDRLARLRTQVNIDPVMEEIIDETEKADKNAKEVFTKLSKDASSTIPKDPDTGKKITIKPYTEKLTLDENLFKESIVDEDYNVREYSDQLYDMIEDDVVDAKKIAEDLIYWCSEDDVKEFMRVNDLIFDNEEYDESLKEYYEPFFKTFNEFVSEVYGLKAEELDELDDDELDKYYNDYKKYIRNKTYSPHNKSLPSRYWEYGLEDVNDIPSGDSKYNESLEKKSLSEDFSVEPGKVFTSKSGHKIVIKSVVPYISSYNGEPSLRINYDFELTSGESGNDECSAWDLFNMLHEDLNLLEYVNEEDEEDDDYTVYDLLNDRLFGYGINKSNFRVKWKFAEVEPTVKTRDGKLKRGYFYPTIHQDELTTGKSDDRRAFTEDGIGVFVHDEDEASLVKKCAEELNLDFVMKKLVRPHNGFNYIATIKVSDDIQEMPIKDYMESIGKSMSDLLRGKGDKIKSNFKDSKNYQSRKTNKEQQETAEE